MNPVAVGIQGLCFAYPGCSTTFLSHLDLEIAAGSRFGLFGPNGAGKTTLLSLMTGLLHPDQGTIRIFGNETRGKDKAVNRLFGLVPQELSFYQELTPAENLEFFGAWSGLDRRQIKQRTIELLSVLGLRDVEGKPVAKFSGGMKRRVNLAIGLMHQPEILFLDEPTVGVDVQTRHAIIGYLKELNKRGTTLVYTSHQLNEAEDLCDRIALMDEGRIIAHDDLDTLLSEHGQSGLEALFLELTGKCYRDVDV